MSEKNDQEGWVVTALLAKLAPLAVMLHSAPAHADDFAQWQKSRNAAYAAFRAAHPDPESEIASVKAKTMALIAAYVAPPTPPKYSDLRAKSAALTADQRAHAQALFGTGFQLWQAGDYASAGQAFADGLAIDPANGMANYYMGDIQKRKGAGSQAALFMDMAATLAPDSVEAYKARTALKELPPIANDPALDRAPVIWKVSSAPLLVWDGPAYPEMIVIPAGEYTMGSPPGKANSAQSSPRHRVQIGYALAVSKYPVTVAEFAQFVAETHYEAANECLTGENSHFQVHGGRNWKRPGFPQTNDNPVVCLKWRDTKAYLAWLTAKTGHKYRLLSESEYEYANRAGTTAANWWGEGVDDSKYMMTMGLDSTKRKTSSVGSFPPNNFGLYDTTGNSKSWLLDCANFDYVKAPTNGSPYSDESCSGDYEMRMRRGGRYFLGGPAYDSYNRDDGDADKPEDGTGFRVAREL